MFSACVATLFVAVCQSAGIQVHVRPADGSATQTHDFPVDATVGDLRAAVGGSRMKLGDVTLCDDRQPLADAGICPEAHVQLHPTPTVRVRIRTTNPGWIGIRNVKATTFQEFVIELENQARKFQGHTEHGLIHFGWDFRNEQPDVDYDFVADKVREALVPAGITVTENDEAIRSALWRGGEGVLFHYQFL